MEAGKKTKIDQFYGNDNGDGLRRKFADVENQDLVELLVSLLQFNPAFRLTAREALQHPVFKELLK